MKDTKLNIVVSIIRDVKASRPVWPRGQIMRPRPRSIWPRPWPHGIWPRPRGLEHDINYLQSSRRRSFTGETRVSGVQQLLSWLRL